MIVGARTWIESWPVYRQLTGTDRLGPRRGRPRAARSARPRGRGPPPPTRSVKSVCPYCAVGCGQNVYVKDEKVVQIEGDPDSPGQPRPPVPQGVGQPAADHRRCPPVPGALPPPGRHRVGAAGPGHGDGHDRRPGHRRPAQGLAVGVRRPPHPAHDGLRQPGRRHPGQRRELPDQEAVHRAGRDPDREPGADMTLLHSSRSGN